MLFLLAQKKPCVRKLQGKNAFLSTCNLFQNGLELTQATSAATSNGGFLFAKKQETQQLSGFTGKNWQIQKRQSVCFAISWSTCNARLQSSSKLQKPFVQPRFVLQQKFRKKQRLLRQEDGLKISQKGRKDVARSCSSRNRVFGKEKK